MKQKKLLMLIAMVLVVVLCASVLTACKKDKDKGGSKFTPAEYEKPTANIFGGKVKTTLAPDGGAVTIPTAQYVGDLTKDYRDPKFYTYRDYVAATTTLKWSPLNWETNEDSYLVDYLTSGLYSFVLNETKDGYAIVPEMAAEYPIDVTEEYVNKYDIDKKDATASYGVKWDWVEIEKEEYDKLASEPTNSGKIKEDKYTFEEALARNGLTFEQFLEKNEMTEEEYLKKIGVETKEEALAREFTDYYKRVNDTKKAFRIKLNQNAKWQGGTIINADTYMYSMKALLDPAFQNRRADSFYAGSFVLHNAKNYFYQGQKGIFPASSVLTVYNKSDDAKLIFTLKGNDSYVADYLTSNGVDPQAYVAQAAKVTVDALKAIEGKSLAEIKNDETMLATWNAVLGWWQTEPNEELHFFKMEYAYPAVDFDKVGLVKVDDYTIDFIVDNPIEQPEYYVPYNLSSTYLVKQDLYEATISEENGLKTSKYGTDLANTCSYGPYKLSFFQNDAGFTFVRNDDWHGYNDGKHYGQYQTDKIEVVVIGKHSTALETFLKGDLDNIGLSADDMAKYGSSKYIRYTPQSYTTKLSFNTNYDSLVKHGTNSQILILDEFRKAFSLAIDRNTFAKSYTSAGTAGYGLLNYMYVYDPIQGMIYRENDAAKAAIVELYGVTYGEDGDYETLDEAYDAVTGYNIGEARQLMQAAYDKAINLGIFRADQTATLEVRVYKDDDVYVQMFNFLNTALKDACVGTSFEGKVSLTMKVDEDYYDSMNSGATDIIFTTWGGAASSPFTILYQCYCDASDGTKNQNEYGFDTSKVNVTLNIDDVDYTASLQKWALWVNDSDETCVISTRDGKSLEKFSKYSYDTRCQIFALLEKVYLSNYATTPLYYRNTASLVSQKGDYAVTSYIDTVGFGGIQYYTYNYDDTEWAAKVAGGLSY